MMRSAPQRPGTSNDPVPPITVLCVDDNRDLVELLRIMVNAESGMVALDGVFETTELVRVVAETRPRVAVVDLTMPGSVQPIEALRDVTRRCPDTRVVAYSGYDDPQTRDEALDAGAWGFVSKHGEPFELMAAVRAAAAGEPLGHRAAE